MKKIILSILLSGTVFCAVMAQPGFDGNELQGEFGVSIGTAHYFGDLNTNTSLNRLKPAVGVYFRKK